MIRELTPRSWALRAVIAVGPPLALVVAAPEGYVPSVWFSVVVVVAALVYAAMPEHLVAGLVNVLVIGWWAAAVEGGLPFASVVAAAALLAAHVAATLAAYGPTRLSPGRRITLLWLRRGIAVWLVAPLVWVALVAQEGEATPDLYWVAGLVVGLIVVVLLALRFPPETDRGR
jgi:hypothetical protein